MAAIGDGDRPASSLLEGIVAAIPDAVVGTDAEFRVTVWNAAAERLYGYTKGEAIGRFARELATLVGEPSHVELEELLARDGRVQRELRARRGDGTIVELEVFISRVHDPLGYVGVHRDVTERRVADLGRRRLAAIVRSASDFIGLSDLEGRPLFLNDAGRRMVGLNSMDAVRPTAISEFFVRRSASGSSTSTCPTSWLTAIRRGSSPCSTLRRAIASRSHMTGSASMIRRPASRSRWRRSCAI